MSAIAPTTRNVRTVLRLVGGLFLLAFAVAPFASAQVPNPVVLSSYDVHVKSGAHTETFSNLNVGLVHHLDVNNDGGSGQGCQNFAETGEAAGRCDANPDITVRVTIETSFADLLTVPSKAPVVRINRAPSAVLEGRPAPPLEVLVTFHVEDTLNIDPDMDLSFGYRTPPGGTIPPRLTAVVGGLTPPVPIPAGWQPFNPLELVVDSGQFSTLSGANGVPPTYSGPLTLLGGVDRAAGNGAQALDATFDLAYRPLPERLRVTWTRNAAQHRNIFTYEHDAPGLREHVGDPTDCDPVVPGCPRDVDLTAVVDMEIGSAPTDAGNEHLDATVSIDRLPASDLIRLPNEPAPFTVDITALTEENKRTQGTADLSIPVTALNPSGRLPDARIDLRSQKPSTTPGAPPEIQVVRADIEQLPNHLRAHWYLPVKPTAAGNDRCKTIPQASVPPFATDRCLADARLEVVPVQGASAPHVGAVELSVANHDADDLVAFTPHVPERDQYVNLQSGPVAPGSTTLQQLLSARAERIRVLDYAEQTDGHLAHAKIGDGAAPLEIHVGTDERTLVTDANEAGTDDDEYGTKTEITALAAPLPDDLLIDLQTPDEATARPLSVTWDARPGSATKIVLDADVEIRGKLAADGAACGEPYTTCATAAIDHLPTFGTFTYDGTDDATLIKVATTPELGVQKPDLVADIASRGAPTDPPFVGHVDVRRLPTHLTMRALTPFLEAEEGEVPERGLTRLQVHPCDYNFATRACTPATAGQTIGAVTFDVRSFLNRPPSLPHTPMITTPMGIAAAVREGSESIDVSPVADSLLFEVSGHLTEVRELQYLNPGEVVGGRIRAGDGTGSFTAAVDVGKVTFSDDAGATPEDLRATAVLHTLPTEVDLCFRASGEDVGGDVFDADITATCEDDQPFGEEVTLVESPLSLALDANDEFVLDVDFTTVDRGASDSDVTDDATVLATLHVDAVPQALEAHIQTPPEDGDGPIRAVFDSAAPEAPVTVEFAAEVRDGDLYCTDPRRPIEVEPDEDGSRAFQSALCLSGTISNLPTHAQLTYDPAAGDKNLRFEHDGGVGSGGVDLNDVLLTSVSGDTDDQNFPETPETDADDAHVASVLVAEGSLTGLPELIVGDLVLPGTVELRSVDPDDPDLQDAGTPIEAVSLQVRNFIAPDPMDDEAPAQRADGGTPLPAPNQELLVFQRDDLFKAIVEVTDLVKAGFATSRDVDGNLLDTNVVTVDFGTSEDVIRAYADLQLFTEEDDPATPVDEHAASLAAVIADVTLQDKPAGVVVCFRGEKLAAAPPAQLTFCDTAPSDDEGAFQYLGRPFDDAAAERLDIDAFIRHAGAGGTDVLATTASIDNVPLVVQGTFGGDGRLDVGGFELDEAAEGGPAAGAPDGIDRITFELANFDLEPAAHGYVGDPAPWGQPAPGFDTDDGEPFSRVPLSNHFVRVRAVDDLFFLQGALGIADAPADSELQRVFLSSDACEAPASAPADYPHFPAGVAQSYTCVQGTFDQVGGGTAEPLLLDVTRDDGDERLTLNGRHGDDVARAGLSGIPRSFSATLAKTATQDANGALRPPCGPASAHADDDVSCMPPLIRLDVDRGALASDPSLFAVLESGTAADLRDLRETGPAEQIAGSDADGTVKDGNGLAEFPDVDGFNQWDGGHGARVRLATYKETLEDVEVDRKAVIAGLHLPISASLTVDQLQTFSCSDGSAGCPDMVDPSSAIEDADPGQAKDLRIHYVARNADGSVVDTLGQLALMIVDEEGKQTLLANPNDPDTEDDNEGFLLGVRLPGELGLQLYQRDAWDAPADDKQRSRAFMQIDGRISSATAIGARLFTDEVKVVDAALVGMPTVPDGDVDPLSPSFRLRLLLATLKSTDTSGPPLGFEFEIGGAEGACAIVILFCTVTYAEIDRVTAEIDFSGARRVDALVSVDKPANGIEMRGYSVLHGTAAADEAPISLSADVDLDPLLVFIHLGIPVFAGADLLFWADVDASLDYLGAEQLRWRNHLLGMQIQHDGPGIDGDGGNVNIGIVPYIAGGVVSVVIPAVIVPFWFVWGFQYAWIPAVGPPVDITYVGCDFNPVVYNPFSNDYDIDPGEDSESIYADVSFDPRFVQYGLGKLAWVITKFIPTVPTGIPGVNATYSPLLTIFSYIAGCGLSSPEDVELVAQLGDVGPPVAVDHHPVPGFGDTTVSASPPPAPPAPPPALSITDTTTMCGRQVFDSVTVQDGGTLVVGSAAGPYCSGAPGDAGRLELIATTVTVRAGGTVDATGATGVTELYGETVAVEAAGSNDGRILGGTAPVLLRGPRRVQVDGVVSADGVQTATAVAGGTAADGNGGGGHGGTGGAGTPGAGGTAFGDLSLDADQDTGLLAGETGAAGAGPGTPGRGGGEIQLIGSTVRISGTVSASGSAGSDSTTGTCAVPDDPDTEADETLPNTGGLGSGGGSGGAVAITAQVLDTTGGVLSVAGGPGGSGKGGGGGGGAAGIVKVAAPVRTGGIATDGGAGGGNGGCADKPAGGDGGGGQLLVDDKPSSWSASPSASLVASGVELDVPYAAASKVTDEDGFHVVLCGVRRPPEAAEEEEPEDSEAKYGIDMPETTTRSVSDPCGTDTDDTTTHVLNRSFLDATTVADPGAVLRATSESGDAVQIDDASGNGYWGFYTVVVKPQTDGNDCFAVENPFTPFFDAGDCIIEDLPVEPDVVITVDNAPPSIDLAGPSESNTETVQLTISDVADRMPRSSDGSLIDDTTGIADVECSNDGVEWTSCFVGTIEWQLTDGSGAKTVHARATDRAGNTTVDTLDIALDVTPPDSTVTLSPASPDGSNGWYRSSPTFELSGFDDLGGAGAADVPYEYWFDGGPHRPCPNETGTAAAPVCTVDAGLPGVGAHTFSWQAVDRAGHRSAPQVTDFKVDGLAPQVDLLTAPFAADAANGWFGVQPFTVVSAFDEPGGSGLVPVGASDDQTGLFFRVGGTAGDAMERFTGAFRLASGEHTVCFLARDVAGNTSGEQCRVLKVDDEVPVATIATAPASPNGDNGWFRGAAPTASAAGSDPGSGVDASFAGTNGLCGPLPQPLDLVPRPSGVCISIDDGPYVPFTSAMSVPDDGTHDVRAFAVDVAGKRSALATRHVLVDRAAPVTTLRTQPPAPAINNRYRTHPLVMLAAAEPQVDNAGVAEVEYRIDGGGWTTYSAPFLITTDGTHTVEYRSLDGAGNTEPTSTQTIIVDTTPPAANAVAGNPVKWFRPNPANNSLSWASSDAGSNAASTSVLIYGVETLSQRVILLRRIEHTPNPHDPSPSFNGTTAWDGKRQEQTAGGPVLLPASACVSLLNNCTGAPLSGRYWFSVVVTDEAGNVAQSDESSVLEIHG